MERWEGEWLSIHKAPGERPAVVLAGHYLSVCPGTAEDYDISALRIRHGVALYEHIATLADGAHYIIGLLTRFVACCGRKVLRLMETSIHGRAYEVCHSGVDDDEALGNSFFDV